MELVLFNPPEKQLDHELKRKLDGKKCCQTNSVKYLGIHMDKNLTWKRIHNTVKLNETN